MILLDTVTRKLQLKLSGAVATNELPWTVSYVNITTTTFIPASNNGVTTGATAVDIIGVPGASAQRQVKFISVQNADTAIAEVSIIYNDNSTLRTIWKGSLAVGDNLQYLDGKGFVVITSSGQIKNTGSMNDHAMLSNLSYASAGHTGFQATLGNSAGLAAALGDETGTGYVVFSDSPAFTTQISTPKIVTQSGNLEITPAASIALMKATTVKSLTNSVEAFGLEGVGTNNRAVSFYTTSDWTGNIDIIKANVGVTTHLTGDGLSYINGGDFRIGSTGNGKFVVFGSTSNIIAMFHNTANCNTEITFSDADSTGMRILYSNATTGGPDKDLIFHNGTNEVMRLTSAGNLGIRVTPTAALHLPAGTTVQYTAPLQFTSGPVESTPRAGLVEYNGRFIVTESDTTNRFLVQAASSTKTTAGAPYTNDGYVTMTVNGTAFKVMTTA